MSDLRKIKKLIELIEESGIGEIEIKEGEETIRISKQSSLMQAQPMMQHMAAPQIATPIQNTPPATPQEAVHAPAEDDFSDKHSVKSPMVGSVYLSASPGSDPFVEIGQAVNIGDTLCLVEAMKTFNQIEADKAGKITARLVENGAPIEFNQPLFIIE